MRKLVGLLVFLALLVVADSAARALATDQIGDELASALNLRDDPQVSIGGFPFIWDLARGELESVSISTDLFETGDVPSLKRLEVDLTTVSFSASDALSGDLRRARVESGRGRAHITSEIWEQVQPLGSRGELVDDISLDDLPGADVSGTTLTLGPTSIELPVLVKGMTYDSVRISGGAIHLTFRIAWTTLQLG